MKTTTPAVPACLSTPYSSKPHQKGGTLIAEGVDTLERHQELLCDPESYRPGRCPRCGCPRLHAHDFRGRVLDDGERVLVESIRRYRCADAACEAVWRILPAVIARHLHRTWGTVQVATGEATRIPATTVRRWLGRLDLVATMLLQMLATAQEAVLAVTDRLPLDCTRAELVQALASGGLLSPSRRLQQLAAWLHRLQPGVRLM